MKYIHVRSLDKYHPGYKDRKLMWARIYFDMFNAEPDFELAPEIDRYRLIFFIITELQLKKPIPVNEPWLTKKGLDLKARPISKTLESLASYLEIQNDDSVPEEKKTTKVQPFKKVEEKIKYLEFVELSNDEFLKLQESLGGTVQDYIKRLDGYIGQIGIRKAKAKYVSHYHTILNWYRKDVADGKVINGTHSGLDKREEADIIRKQQEKWDREQRKNGQGMDKVANPFSREA